MQTIYYVLILFVVISIIIRFMQNQPRRQPPTRDQELEKQSLITEIEGLKKERDSLITFDSHTRLTHTQSQVLDEYEHQGIKIPVDIIDDLVFMNIDDKERLYLFIENQRKNWKNEHMKRFTKNQVTR